MAKKQDKSELKDINPLKIYRSIKNTIPLYAFSAFTKYKLTYMCVLHNTQHKYPKTIAHSTRLTKEQLSIYNIPHWYISLHSLFHNVNVLNEITHCSAFIPVNTDQRQQPVYMMDLSSHFHACALIPG